MNKQRLSRLSNLVIILGIVSIGVWFILQALRQEVEFYVKPSKFLANLSFYQHKNIKLGGVVVTDSVKFEVDKVGVWFKVADFKRQVKVHYSGILPALFKPGKGVVLLGVWQYDHIEAQQVLAKHDENYQPPLS